LGYFLGFMVLMVGLFTPELMEVDASQYASISLEMSRNGSYLQVYHFGNNYLDKPPLIFWFSAILIKLFGASHAVYRFPTFVSTLIGIYATYKLGRRLYDKETGLLAGLFLLTSQAFILHNHDVRTDTLLTNFVIFAIWQWKIYLDDRKWLNFIGTFTGIALAMLTKGPIGIMVPVLAIGSQLLYERNWKMIFNPRWFLGVLWVLVLLSPMLWGLYYQFDANPEAEVNQRVGVSGLRFYFWEQSFGRLTGENVWKDDSSYFFFIHNYLWEFMPWAFLGLGGLWLRFKSAFLSKFRVEKAEVITIGGFILPFIALSTSHYKLPHYILIIMPLAAIMASNFTLYLITKKDHVLRNWSVFQLVLAILVWFIGIAIMTRVFEASFFWWALFFVALVLIVFSYASELRLKLVVPSLIAIVALNFFLNGFFYPRINEYQVGSVLAEYVLDKDIEIDDMVLFRQHYHNLNFYSGRYYYWVPVEIIRDTPVPFEYVFTNEEGLNIMQEYHLPYEIDTVFYNFPNTELSIEFLNKETRHNVLQENYLMRYRGN
jgi:4-amino-4-deoxy-L-arabinose transferase-like glycosyltransferase